jgi:hypothetical protein
VDGRFARGQRLKRAGVGDLQRLGFTDHADTRPAVRPADEKAFLLQA